MGKKLNSPGAKIATLDFLKVDRKLRLPFTLSSDLDSSFTSGVSLGYKEVVVSVEALDTGRILKIVPYKDSNQDIDIVKKYIKY